MRNSAKSRPNKSVRSNQRLRPTERTLAEGVYANNFFMHAATSQVGTAVKLETIQGVTYEGIFKTFSQEFDVVLELAHKIDNNDSKKFDPHEVVDNLIFHAKDIVYMCAQSIELNYAMKDSFTDAGISKFNGEISGEKKLEPWVGNENAEECDLEGAAESNQNGWDVIEMFQTNKELGVGSTYDDSLADYTVQLEKKDTKDFKEEEAKATRIAMEIERNPSSQVRASLENGDNEEELFAAVVRPGSEIDGKYVPPPKRKNSQHHRSGGGGGGGNSRGNYSANGNQRSYNVPESPGRQMNNSTAISRYHHQQPQQYHQQQQQHGQHSQQPMRENSNRSSPENKNSSQCPPAVTQPQNIPPYSVNMHQQQRTFAQNVVPVTNHSQNVPIQQQKSQRTSPISVQAIPNGNADFQPKPIPTVSQQPPHQYHNQNQQTQSGPNAAHGQRKHHQHQPHHSTTRVREDQITELKKFGQDFTLSYDIKNKEAEVPKQIQVVNNRNKSPPTMQPPATERNVVTVSIVPSLPQSKHTTTTPSAQPPMAIPSTQTPTPATHAPVMPPPGNIPNQSVPTTQVGMKPHPQHIISQQATHYQAHPASMPTPQGHQQMHLQQREAQVYMQQPGTQPHPSLPQQTILPHKQQPKQSPHQVPMQPIPVQNNVPIATHASAAASQNQKAVISSQQNVQSVHAQNVLPPNQHQSNSQTAAAQNAQSNSQACVQQRSPPQSQQNIKNAGNPSPPPSAAEHQSPEVEQAKGSKEQDEELDDVASTLKKSTLNPNAKEFVYNPAPKSYTPVSRSPSTPTQSRPHTPQTPSYNVHSVNAAAAGIQMVMPGTYVVAAQPTAYVPAAPPQSSRLRKVTVGPHRTEYHPSNMQVAAATGQPLLAPSVTLSQSPLAPGQFAVQGYSPHPHLVAAASAAAAAQPYQHLQMVRMVPQQGGGVVPLVPSSISYHETSSGATAMYVNHGNAVAMAQHGQHVHHQQQHPPPSTAPSPSQTPQGPSQSHTPNSYQQPPLSTQNAPPYPPVMCPVIQAPPPHGPPHMVAPGQPHTMHQYLQHPQMGHQSHVQVSLIPYS